MKLMTAAQEKKLVKNYQVSQNGGNIDNKPVVKFFAPWGSATWLISEWDGEDSLFGLCDLGHGYPELGYVSLSELKGVVGPFGLKIERDRHFEAKRSLTRYADVAMEKGRIDA